jgi:hypothetical protein
VICRRLTFLLSENTNNQWVTDALVIGRATVKARLTELLPESDRFTSLHGSAARPKCFSMTVVGK